jgi:hypothetical protein
LPDMDDPSQRRRAPPVGSWNESPSPQNPRFFLASVGPPDSAHASSSVHMAEVAHVGHVEPTWTWLLAKKERLAAGCSPCPGLVPRHLGRASVEGFREKAGVSYF